MHAPDDRTIPTTWKTMSYDFRLLFVFHGGMMVLMIVGRVLPLAANVGIAGALAATLCALAVRQRRARHWRWPGVGLKGLLGVVLSLAAGAFFLGAVAVRFTPWKPGLFAWFAAGAAIIACWVLVSLRLMVLSETEFRRQCGEASGAERAPSPAAPGPPAWKRRARAVFRVAFVLVWIAGVGFFWQFNSAYGNGTPERSAERTEALVDHGRTVYVTPEESRRVHVLQLCMMLGIPSVLAAGALLHFKLGVRLFPDTQHRGDAGSPPRD